MQPIGQDMEIPTLFYELGRTSQEQDSNIFIFNLFLKGKKEYILRPTFKNPNFESMDELGKTGDLHKIRLFTF